MLEFPAPQAVVGEKLATEIETATGLPATVMVAGDVLRVVTDADEQTVADVIATHDGVPTVQVDPQAEFAEAIEAATSVADLKAALLGKSGHPAMAQARGKSA